MRNRNTVLTYTPFTYVALGPILVGKIDKSKKDRYVYAQLVFAVLF